MGALGSKPTNNNTAAPATTPAPETDNSQQSGQVMTLLSKGVTAIKDNKIASLVTVAMALFALYQTNPSLFNNLLTNPMSILPRIMGGSGSGFGHRRRSRHKKVKKSKQYRKRSNK